MFAWSDSEEQLDTLRQVVEELGLKYEQEEGISLSVGSKYDNREPFDSKYTHMIKHRHSFHQGVLDKWE